MKSELSRLLSHIPPAAVRRASDTKLAWMERRVQRFEPHMAGRGWVNVNLLTLLVSRAEGGKVSCESIRQQLYKLVEAGYVTERKMPDTNVLYFWGKPRCTKATLLDAYEETAKFDYLGRLPK